MDKSNKSKQIETNQQNFITFTAKFTLSVQDDCKSKASCGECIQAGPECNWCASEEFQGERCDRHESLVSKNCKSIVDEPTEFLLVRNSSLSEVPSELEQNVNQIQPQAIYIKLRKNRSAKFKIKYRQVIDYPVDLYYLMDLSFTMKDDSKHLNICFLVKPIGL